MLLLLRRLCLLLHHQPLAKQLLLLLLLLQELRVIWDIGEILKSLPLEHMRICRCGVQM